MYHPRILAAIEGGHWAITGDALSSVIAIAQRQVTEADRAIFHAATEAEKTALVADLGERVEGSHYSYIKDGVGVMYLDGPIIPRADMFSAASGMTSVESLNADITMFEGMGVKDAIILCDTPGGVITGISGITNRIKSSAVNFEAFVYGMAASAGYWIASGCSKIHVADTAELGSIGVVSTYRLPQEGGGDTLEIVSSQSPLKRPNLRDPEHITVVQGVVDSLADVFVETVATNMGVTADTVINKFGGGSLLIGAQAVAAGMAHSVTTLQTLLQEKSSSTTGTNKTILIPETITGNSNNRKGGLMTPEEFKVAHPAAFAEIGAQAVAADHTRIQSIEALSASCANLGAGAQAAATKVINDNKFNVAMDGGAVAMQVMGAANAAAGNFAANTAADAAAANLAAAEIPTDAQDDASGDDTDDATKAAEASAIAGMASAIN